jgi:hypothetical protein
MELFATECTSVIEIMYDNPADLHSPSAFYAAAIARKLDYWSCFL